MLYHGSMRVQGDKSTLLIAIHGHHCWKQRRDYVAVTPNALPHDTCFTEWPQGMCQEWLERVERNMIGSPEAPDLAAIDSTALGRRAGATDGPAEYQASSRTDCSLMGMRL